MIANVVTGDGCNISITTPYIFNDIQGWIAMKLVNGHPSQDEKTETIKITYWLNIGNYKEIASRRCFKGNLQRIFN